MKNHIEKNNIIENEHGITISYNEENHIEKNNFIKNNQHAFFEVAGKFRKFLNNFRKQVNYWDMNYWDNLGGSSQKIIRGTNELMIPILVLFPEPHIEYIRILFPFPTNDFDFNPAEEPYDI